MDWKDAIAALKKIEGADKLSEAVEAEITRIDIERQRVIGENQSKARQVAELQKWVDNLVNDFKAEGDTTQDRVKSLNEKLKLQNQSFGDTQKQLDDLKAANQQVESLKTELEKKLVLEQRRVQIRDAAIAVGASAKVLETILPEGAVVEIVNGEAGRQVFVVSGDQKKLLKEYAEVNAPEFMPSLFPTTLTEQPKEKRLPTGAPTAQGEKPKDFVADYLKNAGYNGI